MAYQTWQQLLTSAPADGTAVTATSEGSLLNAMNKFVLPAGFLFYEGQALRIRAAGRISNIVTTPGTLTLRFKLGPTSTIVAAASTAMQLNAVAKTNVTWILDWDFTARTVGAGTSATLMHTGTWQSESVVGSPLPAAGGAGCHMIPASAPAVGTGFDSAVANVIDLTAQFSLTGNSITCHSFKLESLN